MRLLHITEDFVRSGGGLPVVIASHLAWQRQMGWQVKLLHTAQEHMPDTAAAQIISCPSAWPGKGWRWSWQLRPRLRELFVGGVDVVHLHGIWTAPQAIGSSLSHRYGVPSVITFHGQLLDRAVGRSLKKRLYLGVMGNRTVRRAKVLHAITTQERDGLKHLFPGKEITLIPNYIDVEEADRQITLARNDASVAQGKQIVYLGRLDVRKGVELLFEAFLHANLPDEWMLCIAGPDDTPGLRDKLKAMARQHRMESRVSIRGALYGKKKWQLLSGAALVCLPSFHEVIGMVNLEAALCARPVLTTPYCGLEGWSEAGGMLTEPAVEDMARALQCIAGMSEYELDERGKALRQWVVSHYGLEHIRAQWVDLYRTAI